MVKMCLCQGLQISDFVLTFLRGFSNLSTEICLRDTWSTYFSEEAFGIDRLEQSSVAFAGSVPFVACLTFCCLLCSTLREICLYYFGLNKVLLLVYMQLDNKQCVVEMLRLCLGPKSLFFLSLLSISGWFTRLEL